MIELCNALKFITMLIFIQNILTFNLGVAFLKSVSIFAHLAKKSKYLKPVFYISSNLKGLNVGIGILID